MLFIGLDLGSTGIRAIASDENGKIVAQIQVQMPIDLLYRNCPDTSQQIHEQNPYEWKRRIIEVLNLLIKKIKSLNISINEVVGICSDSTSGSIIPVDKNGKPLTNAIMYNDSRAEKESELINNVSEELCQKLGYRFKSSFALPKILWIKNHLESVYKNTFKFLHANDFITGILSDEYYHSDISNCLKAGYDFIDEKWPDFIEYALGLSLEKFPSVVPSGTIMTYTSTEIENLTGLPKGIPIISGATDSIAALVASGVSKIGDIFTSLGTTLVTRVLTSNLIKDPLGRAYCHLFPGKKKIFLPGGASSVGSLCLQHFFPKIDYNEYDTKALELFPVNIITYPLIKKGERFPFIDPDAHYFCIGKIQNDFEHYTSLLQGVAFVERMSIEVLEKLGIKTNDRVFTIGGATKSKEWLQIRADVLNKSIIRPKIIEAAYGCIIIAISTIIYDNDLESSINNLVKKDLIMKPREKLRDKIDQLYNIFKDEVNKRFNLQLK